MYVFLHFDLLLISGLLSHDMVVGPFSRSMFGAAGTWKLCFKLGYTGDSLDLLGFSFVLGPSSMFYWVPLWSLKSAVSFSFFPRSSTNFIGDYFIASPSLCLSFLSYSSTPFLLELGLLFSSLLFWFLWSLFSFFCTYASFFVAGRKYFLFPWHYTLFTRNMWWFYYPNVTLSIYVILNIEKGTQGSENFIIHENTLS